MSLVYAVPGATTEAYHRLRSCAGRGGSWPPLRLSERAARWKYGLHPCGRCWRGR